MDAAGPAAVTPSAVGRPARRQAVADWQDRVREPSLNVVLGLQIVLIFVVTPLMEMHALGHWALQTSLIALAAVSVFVVARGGMARLLILAALAAMLLLPAGELMLGMADPLRLPRTAAGLLFVGTLTWVVAGVVFAGGQVSLHRIQGAIVVYLNLALGFAVIFDSLPVLIAKPFAGTGAAGEFGSMLYFSLTTLTTTGFGDVVPLHPIARSLANLESMVGQLFPATLLASLVGQHLMHRGE